MAESDLAFIQSFRSGEDRRRREEDRQRGIEREGVLAEREDIGFKQQQTLFQQQQQFAKAQLSELGQEEWRRKANKAIAIFRGTSGQVYQPLLDLYKEIPDGGMMHAFKRNDDGTFSLDFEWQGQRHKTDKATFDEVAAMGMSIMDPQSYLQQSGASAAATLAHQRSLELQAVKNLGKARKTAAGETEFEKREQFFAEYESLLQNNPDNLTITDPQSGEERLQTFNEYLDLQRAALGEAGDTGKLIDVDFDTISLAEMTQIFEKEHGLQGEQAVNAAVTAILSPSAAPQRAQEFAQILGIKPPGEGAAGKGTLSLPPEAADLIRRKAGIRDPAIEVDDVTEAAGVLGAGGDRGAVRTEPEPPTGEETSVLPEPGARQRAVGARGVPAVTPAISTKQRTETLSAKRKRLLDTRRKASQLGLDLKSGTANEADIRAIAELSVQDLVEAGFKKDKAQSLLRQAKAALSQ